MQNTQEERFIPTFIPQDARVYHKTGLLEDDVHDAAIIEQGSRKIVLVILTHGQGQQDYPGRATFSRDY